MQTWIDPRMDRTKWEPGVWDDEPDKAQWKDEATGMDCIAKRVPHLGHWCGYVGVPPTHPLHSKEYSGVDVSVHGGLTYADACQHGPAAESICHVPAPGEPDGLWWFGFDCAHSWDASPGRDALDREHGWGTGGGSYKTLRYVQGQCADLARQLAGASSEPAPAAE